MDSFDFNNPDYKAVFAERARRLSCIRSEPDKLPAIFKHYQKNPADFINDWGMTFDPRNPEKGLPSAIPFLLFPKQAEWVRWCVSHWESSEIGLVQKSRDMGLSWLSVAVAVTLCIFNKDMVIGFGSRKEEYVDKIGDPKSLFWKAREFVSYLPIEFRGGFCKGVTDPHMRVLFPATGSSIIGEAGDNIGRGNRSSIYFVDEAAFIERPHLVEASLSQTTNCRIDISTPNGLANPFAAKIKSGKFDVFTFHWKDDPRKGQIWYDKQKRDLDPVTLAQEIDLNYSASVDGVLIPSSWVQAAIDAHIRLGFDPTGGKVSALDVADLGADYNAQCFRNGVLLEDAHQWRGESVEDIFGTTQRAIDNCDRLGYSHLIFDSDGMGVAVRGDARVINEDRASLIHTTPFNGGSEVLNKKDYIVKRDRTSIGRTNGDFFSNYNAQSAWSLRERFRKTHDSVESGTIKYPEDELISISSQCGELDVLISELSQPTFSKDGKGKMRVDKAPKGASSPNLFDSIKMVFSESKKKKRTYNFAVG